MAGVGEKGEARVPGQEVRVFLEANPAELLLGHREASGSTRYREDCAVV